MTNIYKIATWNINSINVRIEHLLNVMREYDLDVLAIQETKAPDNQFPIERIAKAGYHVIFSGQKSYNGTCIVSKKPCIVPPLSFLAWKPTHNDVF